MKRIMQKSILFTLLLSVGIVQAKSDSSRLKNIWSSFKQTTSNLLVKPSQSGLSTVSQFLMDYLFNPVSSGASRVKNVVADGATKGYKTVAHAVGNHSYASSSTAGVACYLPAKQGAKMFWEASRLHKLIAVLGLAGCGCACKVSGMSCENINPKVVASFLAGIFGAAGLDQLRAFVA